jgi:hypothetical protein
VEAKLIKFFTFIEKIDSINIAIMTDIFRRKESPDDYEAIKKLNNYTEEFQ